MVKLVRTHTYFMTYKEYKRRFLKGGVNKKVLMYDIPTRTHIRFQ